MSSDLLPESVNLFLDDFETSLCLPILAVMVLCTAQFLFNYVVDIANMIYQAAKRPATVEAQDKQPADMMGKLKGILTTLGHVGKPDTTEPAPFKKLLSPAIGTHSQEEEWDYCEENTE